MLKRVLTLILPAVVALVASGQASASGAVRYGIQDDAWLEFGPGTLDDRLDRLDALGVDIVRYTIRWDKVAPVRPARERTQFDPAYDWDRSDSILEGLRDRHIAAVVTLLGTPRWASGRSSPFWVPRSGTTFGNFAFVAGRRYPWVKRWLIWSEPNQRRGCSPRRPRSTCSGCSTPAMRSCTGRSPRCRSVGV